ncbi:MAG: NosR/NirI family nitrous oxide reductase transcriptional regulator, partial [Paraglaciecola sp.]
MPCAILFLLTIYRFGSLLVLLLSFHTLANNNTTLVPPDIAHIYPSATRVGPQDPDIAVTPVYQLDELLGYTFESNDFTHFIGYSGQTINMLIGLDPQGVISGITLLNHHEPIFLHGLGEEPMLNFIDQYPGHSIRER